MNNKKLLNLKLKKCYCQRFVESILTEKIWFQKFQETTQRKIDLFLVNSQLWDSNRQGPLGFEDYQQNVEQLLKNLPGNTHCFYLTTPPSE